MAAIRFRPIVATSKHLGRFQITNVRFVFQAPWATTLVNGAFVPAFPLLYTVDYFLTERGNVFFFGNGDFFHMLIQFTSFDSKHWKA